MADMKSEVPWGSQGGGGRGSQIGRWNCEFVQSLELIVNLIESRITWVS